mgnify:CR=1 FL=1
MRPLAELEAAIEQVCTANAASQQAEMLLGISEEVLEHWIRARGDTPTAETREGFRLLALHRQGAKGDPSFNACRETCRELVYHYNLLKQQPEARRLTVQCFNVLLEELAIPTPSARQRLGSPENQGLQLPAIYALAAKGKALRYTMKPAMTGAQKADCGAQTQRSPCPAG